MAEWLGTGLQNQVQQFDSAWYLKTKGLTIRESFCFGYRLTPVAIATSPSRGIGRNLLRRTRVASWLVSFGHIPHSATALMRLGIL